MKEREKNRNLILHMISMSLNINILKQCQLQQNRINEFTIEMGILPKSKNKKNVQVN